MNSPRSIVFILIIFIASASGIGLANECTHESVLQSISPKLWKLIADEPYEQGMTMEGGIHKASVIMEAFMAGKGGHELDGHFYQLKQQTVAELAQQMSIKETGARWTQLPEQEKVTELMLALMAKVLHLWAADYYETLLKQANQLTTKGGKNCDYYYRLMNNVKMESQTPIDVGLESGWEWESIVGVTVLTFIIGCSTLCYCCR